MKQYRGFIAFVNTSTAIFLFIVLGVLLIDKLYFLSLVDAICIFGNLIWPSIYISERSTLNSYQNIKNQGVINYEK